MMQLFCVKLRLRSALGTPLTADTLWGHVAWGIRNREGEAALIDWLDQHDTNTPPLVLSDPFPAGFWPRPCLPAPAIPSLSDTAAAIAWKRLGKRVWISHSAWQKVVDELDANRLVDILDEANEIARIAPTPKAAARTRIGVNRFTGGTLQDSGGAVFTLDELFYPMNQEFDLWGVSSVPIEQVSKWISYGIEGGYGRDSAAGLGRIEVVSVQATAFPTVKNANASIVLGSYVPKVNDPCHGLAKMGIRAGRLGGDFARNDLPGTETIRQKRPVSFLAPGSLIIDFHPQLIRGRCLSHVHPGLPGVRFPGWSPMLPCRVANSVLHDPILKEIL